MAQIMWSVGGAFALVHRSTSTSHPCGGPHHEARAAAAPGNVPLAAGTAGLERDCAVNVSQLLTLDRAGLADPLGVLGQIAGRRVDQGLSLVLGRG